MHYPFGTAKIPATTTKPTRNTHGLTSILNSEDGCPSTHTGTVHNFPEGSPETDYIDVFEAYENHTTTGTPAWETAIMENDAASLLTELKVYPYKEIAITCPERHGKNIHNLLDPLCHTSTKWLRSILTGSHQLRAYKC
jgi:hypothetical protein